MLTKIDGQNTTPATHVRQEVSAMVLRRQNIVVRSPLNALEKQIKDRLDGIIAREESGRCLTRDRWTKEVKRVVTKLGHDLNWVVSVHGIREADDPQWLLDLVWVREYSDGKNTRVFLREIGLGMESEWNRSAEELDWDFQKLLAFRARLRLFVFEQKDRVAVEKIIKRCQRQIEGFDQSELGDRYLLAGCSNDEVTFKVVALTVKRR